MMGGEDRGLMLEDRGGTLWDRTGGLLQPHEKGDSSMKRCMTLVLAMMVWGVTGSMSLGAEEAPAEAPAAAAAETVIDTMDDLSKNSLGGRNSTYLQAPSRAAFTKAEEYGKNGGGLKITYDLKNEGGPRGDGGFCGFYTLVKKGTDGYLDGSPYKYLTFWVKGDKGDEKFKVGVADKMYETMDDSVKSQEISKYLPAGRVTTDWQMAVVPVEDFFVDWKLIASISICFEHDTFDNGAGAGVVYIDEIALRKDRPGPEVAPTVPEKKP